MPSLLSQFDRFLKVGLLWSRKHSLRVSIVTALVFAFFLSSIILWTRQSVSVYDQLDPRLETTQDLKKLKSLFPQDPTVGMVWVPAHPPSSQEVCEFKKFIHRLSRNTQMIQDELDFFEARQTQVEPNRLYYPALLPDPCASDAPSPYPLDSLSGSPWQGTFTDRHLRDFGAFFSTQPLSAPGRWGTFNLPALEFFVSELEGQPKWPIFWTGISLQEFFTLKGMAQTQWLNFGMVILILVSLRLLFGTWKSGLLFLGTLFFSITVVYGGMALVGHPLDPLGICLLMMLAVASLEDFIFVSYDRMIHPQNEGFPIKSYFRLITPSFFTSFTTAIGFGSLIISDLSSISRFGFWAALGASLEWVSVFWILPALARHFPSFNQWVCPEKAVLRPVFEWFSRLSLPPLALKGSLVVFLLAILSSSQLKLAQDPSAMFPKDHIFQKSLNYFKESRGWIAQADLVFSPGLSTETRGKVIEFLRKRPEVLKVEDFKSVFEFVSQKVTDPTQRNLVHRELRYSPFADSFFARSGEERVHVYLSSTQTDTLDRLYESIKNLCPQKGCFLAGEFIAFSEFSKVFITTLFQSLLMSLLLVGLVIAFLNYQLQIRQLPSLLIASFWGPAWLLTSLYLLGGHVNSITCVVASTVIGLTGDNAIQFIFAGGKKSLKNGIDKLGPASIQCNIIMSLASLVFLGSYFEPPRDLGILFVIGFMSSLVGDLWILKGLASVPSPTLPTIKRS